MQDNNILETEIKNQYILDENKELKEIPMDKCKPVEHPIKFKLKNAFEVFVRVDSTENYWISNYGRTVNNLNLKDKNNFYIHKEGKCHITVFEIERYISSCHVKDRKSKRTVKNFPVGTPEAECNAVLEEMQKSDSNNRYTLEVERWKRDTTPEDLVAETFLVQYKGRYKIWHKDGDESNNWYKNLLMVSADDFKNLKSGKVIWQELNLEQEYIEYENKATYQARRAYESIKARCKDTTDSENVRSCYDKSTMWQVWLDDPKKFIKWYLLHYYDCNGEEMNVDKDLFGDGSGMYHEEFCCLLPKGLNTLLANSKKHYKEGETPENTLPLGVRYNSKKKKYYAEITFTGDDRITPLSEWDTAEEAFAEYKMMKQADILMVVARYKKDIPDYIYNKFLTVEVKPY